MSNETENLKSDVNSAVQNAKESAANTFGQLKDDAQRIAQSAKDAGRAGVAQVQDKVEQFKDQARTKYNEGSEVVRDAAYRARSRGNDLLGQVQNRIEENPLQAVAIAAGVGVVLGVLLRR